MVYQKSETLIEKKTIQENHNQVIKGNCKRQLVEWKTVSKENESGDDAKACFLSMASHEFKTPLSSMLSSVFLIEKYTELIETKNEKEHIGNRNKHISKIKKSILHLTEILNNFLSIDKLDQAKIKLKTEEMNLNTFTEDLLDELKPLLKDKQQITYHFDGNEVIYSDKHLLRNIYLNLISNAIKYSNNDTEIILNIKVQKKDIIIQVIDHGVGIPEKEQAKLFTRFFRATNSHQTEGTGLGLHIVKQYVDLMKGKIDFSSRLNEGTTFIVLLPNCNHL